MEKVDEARRIREFALSFEQEVGMKWICEVQKSIVCFGGGGAPAYTPPPAAPPSATPATLASASVASTAANRQNAIGAAAQDIGTSSAGVAPSSVSTAKQTLGGVS